MTNNPFYILHIYVYHTITNKLELFEKYTYSHIGNI